MFIVPRARYSGGVYGFAEVRAMPMTTTNFERGSCILWVYSRDYVLQSIWIFLIMFDF